MILYFHISMRTLLKHCLQFENIINSFYECYKLDYNNDDVLIK